MYFLLGKAEPEGSYLHFSIDRMSNITALRNEEGMPLKRVSTIRPEEWNPEKYMSEHLYMGYEKPRYIRIKLPKEKITIIHNWFGKHYTTPRATHTEKGFTYVDVFTSPSYIVQWAMQYADIVEIMDKDNLMKNK
ncbi:MAG: WYL domain-containing protein [Ruminiclostridium sp.]